MKNLKINTFFPSVIDSWGLGHACQSIMTAISKENVKVAVFSVSYDKNYISEFNHAVLPPSIERIGYKFLSSKFLISICKYRFLKNLNEKSIIGYFWPSSSIETMLAARKKVDVIIIERINTHQITSKSILDSEFNRMGLEPDHGITDEKIKRENLEISLADFIFSPSIEVTKSLLYANVDPEKILETSYGLSTSDMVPLDIITKRKNRKSLTAVFVGRIGIRKGAHLLLKYWVESGVKGTLKIVGPIEKSARQVIEPYLLRSDIDHVEFENDLKTLYSESDIFMFPSLEEGSPLVTYQAIGAGLPCIVSQMGAAGILTHNKNGIIIDPHDGLAWISAIRQLFRDEKLRYRLSKSAYQLAPNYLWEKIGVKRLNILRERLKNKKLKL